MNDIIYDDGLIKVVVPDMAITKKQLQAKINSLKKLRQRTKKNRDKHTKKMDDLQKKISAYEAVLEQAGGI